MSKNVVETDRSQVTIWYVRFACWITKVTDIHSEYIIFIAFSRHQWLRERVLVLLYTYVACLVCKLKAVFRLLRGG
jgi:hypothetical protein